MEEPGYNEFPVVQVCTGLMVDDLEDVVRSVRELVGVVDFGHRMDAPGMTKDTEGITMLCDARGQRCL